MRNMSISIMNAIFEFPTPKLAAHQFASLSDFFLSFYNHRSNLMAWIDSVSSTINMEGHQYPYCIMEYTFLIRTRKFGEHSMFLVLLAVKPLKCSYLFLFGGAFT